MEAPGELEAVWYLMIFIGWGCLLCLGGFIVDRFDE